MAEDVGAQSTRELPPIWFKPPPVKVPDVLPKASFNEQIREIKLVPLKPFDSDDASESTMDGDNDADIPEKTPTPWNTKRAPTPMFGKEGFMDLQVARDLDGIKDITPIPVPKHVMPFSKNDEIRVPKAVVSSGTQERVPVSAPAATKEVIKDVQIVKVPKHMSFEDGDSDQQQPTWEEDQATRPSHTPGPLEMQLAALMSKVIAIERAQPTISVSQADYAALQARVATLEAEKKTWATRHEALFALRDEDVANLRKVRGLLASSRRDHEALTKLRNDDLANLVNVRGKLADATRKLDVSARRRSSGTATPPSAQQPMPARPKSIMQSPERRSTTTLFEVAKTAAFEQKVLELERHNSNLISQVAILEEQARLHEACHDAATKDLEIKLRRKEEELSRLRESAHSWATTHEPEQVHVVGSGVEWSRWEGMVDENLRYREKMGRLLGGLRGEKEVLQREVNEKDDQLGMLEATVARLEARLARH
ncbi:hypothetical protein EJ05DRAFT_472856 [Pseudovirgaria hyperparasitica]|uniref:Uncharacterized protein n=1 Tax=Pseudovirgaria hyperparasitica TaxID=470096 RepID=A0A6A6WJY1_9PEZI|nr:uncharacterized protein EJ05DRAFT_472856 [Pseudovirgaria hyperparasitica]KAF2761901.1 hypothetical protein EJ05DRAFT_472856 [Pseudovirgaria hyperparasitica]